MAAISPQPRVERRTLIMVAAGEPALLFITDRLDQEAQCLNE
jgi:hypothetical protein